MGVDADQVPAVAKFLWPYLEKPPRRALLRGSLERLGVKDQQRAADRTVTFVFAVHMDASLTQVTISEPNQRVSLPTDVEARCSTPELDQSGRSFLTQ